MKASEIILPRRESYADHDAKYKRDKKYDRKEKASTQSTVGKTPYMVHEHVMSPRGPRDPILEYLETLALSPWLW